MSHSLPESKPVSLYAIVSPYLDIFWRIIASIALISVALLLSS